VKFVTSLLTDVGKERWESLEAESQHTSVFQTYAWATVLKSVGTESRFVMIQDKGTPLIGLLLSRSSFVARALGGYEVMGGPLVVPDVDESVFSSLVSLLKHVMKKESALYFYWSPSFFFDIDAFLSDQGFSRIPSATFVVDLRPPAEALWGKLEKRARWGVKRAQEMGVTVQEAKDWEDWDQYHNMYIYENYQKRVQPRSMRLHRAIFECLLSEEKVKLFLANHNGKVVAGGLFLVTPHEMLYYENAANPRCLSLQPNNAIQWHAISWAKEQGIRYYDLGGALAASDKRSFLRGVHVFKRQWGGKLYEYSSFALSRLYVFSRALVNEKSLALQLYYALEKLGMIKRSDRL